MSEDRDRVDNLKSRPQQQLEFLLTVLSTISKANSDREKVYPLLRQNLDLLDLGIVEVFRDWASDVFDRIDRDKQSQNDGFIRNLISWIKLRLNRSDRNEKSSVCAIVVTFGNLIQEFPFNKAASMELAIECYRAALEVRTQADLPLDWAMTQNNLAAAYSNRIKGDRADNLERAIECYRAALEVYTQADLPLQWATTQNNLANAYSNRIKGDRADNLERAIECYRAALEVYTQADLPLQWAMTQNNLANAYSDRIKGDRADNLERAIECYRAALEVYTTESFPREWAMIQVYLARFSIEQLQNYEFATEHLQSAYDRLSTDNSDAGLLAQTMFELARCFHRTGCLSQAKIYFKDAIRLYQRLEQPLQVAAATSALGNIELQMGHNDDARLHLQTALEFYEAAGNLEQAASIRELRQCLPEYNPEPAL